MIRRLKARAGPWFAAAAFILGIFLMASAGAYTIRQQNHINHKLCQQTIDNRDGIRSTWLAAGTLVLRTVPREQREQTRAFFREILRPIPPLQCVDNKPIPKEG